MSGIVSYGAYIPYWRLQRSAIAAVLGASGGRGTRAVASYDEDTTSMGVEAARRAMAAAPAGSDVGSVYFSTVAPAYLDKTNATAIHAALGLRRSAGAYDLTGSVRSNVAACTLAGNGADLAVLSDLRVGLPGGSDEVNGGDGAAAILFGDGPGVIAETIGSGSSTAEFLDRWRTPGDSTSRQWEERFGEFVYLPLAEEAITDAYKSAGITGGDVDHLIVAGMHARAGRGVAKLAGVRAEAVADDLSTVIGNTGVAHAAIVLADVLDRAEPGQVIAVVQLADGADVWLLRVTDAITAYKSERRKTTVREQIEAGRTDLPYASFLTWRGFLDREPPRRPDPERPAGPPAMRTEMWKFGFEGSRCTACGTRHLPPARVCVNCHATDQMEPERLADVPATIATYTIDRLAFSLSPPTIVVVIDFDGGGRFQCEMTDADPGKVAIGQRVQMTFRRLYTAEGVHNYFWKARPSAF
jgi:hydroxymethylglutaryl-CoA synthase